MHKKTILKGDVSMPKGDYQRKLRRIDYSKKEIADQLNCSENTVDSRIKQLCKDYGLPEGMFKRDGANGTNFFPPEYTPLGLEGKLDIFPVCNVFTRRPRYWKDGELNLFKVHMWNLNELDSEQISEVLEERIMAARMYFGL